MSKKISYLNLATYSQTGGIENFNKTFIKALSMMNDVEISAISIYDSNSDLVKPLEGLKYFNFNRNKIKGTLHILKNIKNTDILILAHVNLLLVGFICKILNPRVKIFVSIYGIDAWKKFPSMYQRFFKKINFFSISQYTSDLFTKLNLVENSSIYYLPPAIDFNVEKNEINPYESGKLNILSVSRLDTSDNYKGIDLMMKALKPLISQYPDLKYTVIGKGNDKNRLMKLVDELGLSGFIEFKGYVEKIEPYYQNCNIFALPSKGEGFGIVYLEAMKYRKACIACDDCGATDVVLHNKTGLLCKYDDVDTLTACILKLLENKENLQLYGDNGLKHLKSEFAFSKFKSRLIGALND